MAIVFESPKRKQRIFVRILTVGLIGGLFLVSLLIFPPGAREAASDISGSGNQPVGPEINLDIFQSDQVQQLQPFSNAIVQFDYVGINAKGRHVSGTIVAANIDQATTLLQANGVQVTSISESVIGRGEPFSPPQRSIRKP